MELPKVLQAVLEYLLYTKMMTFEF